MRLTTALALVAALGAACLIGTELRGEERPVRDRVQELLPRLQSDDDAVRERAEAELFRLGERGRLEMERLSRDDDPRLAVTALRLLQSDRWDAAPLRDGEQPLQRHDGTDLRMEDVERAIERHFEELRRRLAESFRDLPTPRLPPLPRLGAPAPEAAASFTITGSVTRDGRTLSWTRKADGHVSVTVRPDGGDAQTYQAESIDAFRAAHPEVAAELDGAVPSWSGGPTIRVFEGTPDIRVPDGLRRWLEDARDGWGRERPDDEGATTPGEQRATPVPVPSAGPTLGIEWAPLPPLLGHHLRIDCGVVVERVLPGTNAARLGLEPLDVLVELAGRPVSSRADIVAALRTVVEAPLEAVVIRRGERKTLRLPS